MRLRRLPERSGAIAARQGAVWLVEECSILRLYHATSARGAAAIMREGFRDATGSYGLVGYTLTGVIFVDRLECTDAASEAVIVVDAAPRVIATVADHELVEGGQAVP